MTKKPQPAKRDKITELPNDRLLILVANTSYATHYGFTISEWLHARYLVKTIPSLIELSKKRDLVPKIAQWNK